MRCITILFLVVSCLSAISQSVPDKEFDWKTAYQCATQDRLIYRKVEIDPEISGISRDEFEALLIAMVGSIQFSKGASGLVKLKLCFIPGSPVRVRAIGTKGIMLTMKQKETIIDSLKLFENFSPGLQKGVEQNCEGIIYLTISDSALIDSRIINFSFAN